MPPALMPVDESERLATLRSYEVLDTACEENFDRIVRLAARLSGTPVALISLLDTHRQWFKARYGFDVAETPREQAFCAHAILHPSRQLLVPDATQDPRFADNPMVTGSFGVRFYAGVPLVAPEGQALGALCVMDRTPRDLSPEVLDALTTLAQAVMTALELRRALHRMREYALSDALTGLPNRPAFVQALGRALARQHRDRAPFSLLYLDLDGFKQINDRLGHGTGDAVLVAAARLLQRCIRKGGMAARIGGDEFAAVLVGGDGSEAYAVAERVRDTIAAGMAAMGMAVTASVGAIAFLDPPADEAAGMALADAQMYAAKAAGKNQVRCRDFLAAPEPAGAA